MEYSLIRLPRSEVEIKVTLPFSEFEPYLKAAAVLISEEIEIEGFRKGKAPYEVVKNRIGENAIYERAADVAVRKTYPEIMRQLVSDGQLPASSPPIGHPQIEITKLAPGNELGYKAKFAILPTVTLPDVLAIAQRIRAQKKEQVVNKEDVQAALRWLRESRTRLITVNRAAQDGDRVEVDFEIRHGGVKIADGESKNHPMVIGQKKFIPGFEEELIGMKSGEQKSFTLSSPENWHEKSLAGKILDVALTMKLVQERQIPELDDQFAKGMGSFASVAELENSVYKGLQAEKEEKETQRIRSTMIDEIASRASTEVPDILIERELDKMTDELKSGVTDMGMQWENYLVHIKKTPQHLRNEWQKEALRRVRAALILREIAAQQKIEAGEEEIAEYQTRFLQQFRTTQQTGRTIDPTQLNEYAKGVLRNQKVFEWLEKI